MKVIAPTTAVVLGLSFFAFSSQAQDMPPFVQIGIEQATAFAAGDAKRFASYYAEDGAMMWENGPTVKGREGIEMFMQVVMKSGVKYKFTLLDARASGDLGYTAATLMAEVPAGNTFNMPAGSYSGKGITVWKRVNGQWKIAYDIANSDPPPQK